MKQIYTGYQWREMTEPELEILEVSRIVDEKTDDAQAGDIYIAQQEADKQDDNKAFIRYYSPAPSGPDWADDGLEAYCGNCDEDLMDGFESWSYCPHCGKELWSDDGDGHEEKGWL